MNTASTQHYTNNFGPVHLADIDLASSDRQDEPDSMDAGSHRELLLTVALATAHSAPDTRQDRIEAIRAQIANGTYEVNSRRIAESLIRENPGLFSE